MNATTADMGAQELETLPECKACSTAWLHSLVGKGVCYSVCDISVSVCVCQFVYIHACVLCRLKQIHTEKVSKFLATFYVLLNMLKQICIYGSGCAGPPQNEVHARTVKYRKPIFAS